MLKDIISDQQVVQLLQLIDETENIVLCCHTRPDGDAIGACLSWVEFLRLRGKNPVIIIPDQYPDYLQWLPNSNTLLRFDKHIQEAETFILRAQLMFFLDFNAPERTGNMASIIDSSKARRIIIDHHPGSVNKEDTFSIIRPDACATCEVVFRLVWQLGAFDSLGRQFATLVYCGMMTDTGGFTYNSNSADTYYIIGQLLSKGIDKDRIYRNVYNNFSEGRMRLMGYVLYNSMVVLHDLHSAFFSLTRKDFIRFHFVKGDAEGLVNLPLQMKGIRLSISIREDTEKDNLIWISLRSIGQFPCNEMAERFFEGGGHTNAAGGKLRCGIEEAKKKVVKAIESYATLLK